MPRGIKIVKGDKHLGRRVVKTKTGTALVISNPKLSRFGAVQPSTPKSFEKPLRYKSGKQGGLKP